MSESVVQKKNRRSSDAGAVLFLFFLGILLLAALPYLAIGAIRTGWVNNSEVLSQFGKILGTQDVQIQVELPIPRSIRVHNATFVLLVDGERTVYGRCDSADFEPLKCKLTERPETP